MTRFLLFVIISLRKVWLYQSDENGWFVGYEVTNSYKTFIDKNNTYHVYNALKYAVENGAAPASSTNWYLPTAGEWKAMPIHQTINPKLQDEGLTMVSSNYYFCAYEVGEEYAYGYNPVTKVASATGGNQASIGKDVTANYRFILAF